MQPIRDNVLIKPIKGSDVTEGGLYVPDTVIKPSSKCEVIAVGNGIANKPMRYKKGDIVYRTKDWGQEVMVDGELHFLMSQEAVIAQQ